MSMKQDIRRREALRLVRTLWALWGEDRIAEQMGTEILEQFKLVLGIK